MGNHEKYRQQQEDILQAVVHMCSVNPYLIGVAVAGSYARQQNDAFSDLDVDAYFADETRAGAAALHEQIRQIAPTLSVLYLHDKNGLYLFENGVRLDLTYKRLSDLRTDSAGNRRILHDPQGILARELGTEQTTPYPAHPAYFEPGDPAYVHWFLWMFRQVYGWAKRAAQGDHRSFDKLLDAGASLQLIRGSLLQMRRWTSGSMDYIGVADPETAEALAQTYGRLTPADVLIATRQLLAVYEHICPAYCVKARVNYPSGEIASLHRILDAFDVLS